MFEEIPVDLYPLRNQSPDNFVPKTLRSQTAQNRQQTEQTIDRTNKREKEDKNLQDKLLNLTKELFTLFVDSSKIQFF